MKKFDIKNLYFFEPRFQMNMVSRFVVRLIINCGYIVFVVAVVAFLFSDIIWIFWLGVLGFLFLADKLIQLGKADNSLVSPSSNNIAGYLTPRSLSLLERAIDRSLIDGKSVFIFLAKFLIEDRDVKEMIARLDVEPKEFEQKINEATEALDAASPILDSDGNKILNSRKFVLQNIEILLRKSFEISFLNREKFIEPRSIFAALIFLGDKKINKIFNLFLISPEDLENALIFGCFRKRNRWLRGLPNNLGGFADYSNKSHHRVMNRAWTAKTTPNLDRYSIDFTDLARDKKIGFLVGHKQEYEQMVDVLSRQSKPNVLLIGEPGSGKETIVAHLAYEIIKDKVSKQLFDKRLVVLSVGNLISGASSPEDIALRFNKVVEEIISSGNIILYIPDIHNLVKTSGLKSLSVADIISPIINSDAFPVIGATCPREFKTLIESQSDFSGAFEKIRINEISEAEAIKLLTYNSVILEDQYKATISFGAIKQAVGLAHKYFRQKLLPSSAEDLLRESLADATQKKDKFLQADDVIAIAQRKTDIPIHRATKEEAEKLLNLEKIIHQELVDQEEVVDAVSRVIREYRSGLSRRGGPIAVFLFVGPTGVGKTELSKILTKIQFGSEKLMIRFDMSEYQDKQSIFRFIGSSDGRIAGALTEAVIQKPYSLILLDEFEKAHPDILNLFLQVFDDGRLTDSLGRTVDFANTIIVATSNAHSEFIKTHIEAHTLMTIINEELKKKLTDYFKPELLNRFSGVLVFKTLSKSDTEVIAKLQLKDLSFSLEESNGISLVFDDAVIKKIAELGYDPVFGARALRGVISEKIRSVLAEKILRDEIVKGDSVKVVLENNEIKFTPLNT